MNTTATRQFIVDCVRSASNILLRHYRKVTDVRQKDDAANVVCAADLEAERSIIESIRTSFPRDGIIAEETGYSRGMSEFTWVIDPLDGSSNFVAGLPWFGVQIAVLHRRLPIIAAMYLPVEGMLYLAERGRGVYRNGESVSVTDESTLRNTLCSFGLDSVGDAERDRENAELILRVARAVRNIRTTNCLVDFCYVLDGRLGACINVSAKIWDIVPVLLMLPEAGGRVTDLCGDEIELDLDERTFGRDYAILGGSVVLHTQLAAVTGCRKRKASHGSPD